jgi:hypothetical protein
MTKPEPCDEQIVLRLPATLRQAIEQMAVAENRSVANAARCLLQSAVEREAAPVTGGELTTHEQMIAAAYLREAGIPDASIRQVMEGKPAA